MSSKARYLGIRFLQMFLTIWLVITFLFFFFRLMPGDVTTAFTAEGASPESIAEFEENWGLNDPIYVQYWEYMTNLVMLDAGESIRHRVPVWDHVKFRLFNTFILVAPAITASYIAAGILGSLMGAKRGSILEKYGVMPIIFVGTIPEFFTAILLILIFGSLLGWFPISGMLSTQTEILLQDAEWWQRYLTWDFLYHYTLPFTAIFLYFLYTPVLLMRTNVVEVLNQDFIWYHKISGIPRWRILGRVAKHSSLPLITLYPVTMTRAIGGVVLIEMVFNWPGMGYELVNAVLDRDLPVVQFVFYLIAVFIIVANFVVDIVYGYIDPRVSVGDSEGE